MKKYVLTGGPGSGKSSIILALELMGENVINEAAEDYIRYRQAMGVKEPWKEADFQDKILELQLRRESNIPEGTGRIFMDRGVPDGLAYAQPGTKAYKRLENAAKETSYEKKVFVVEPLSSCEKTAVRRENLEEAVKLGEKLEEVYRKLGYEPVKIPAGPLEERVTELLKNLWF